MSGTNGRRPYAKRKRQESQDETRQRIVEATMHLHEAVGPRATTISAIAERAGVTRLTVYRHFPDETAVFQACTTHWLSLNPPPDATAWEHGDSAIERACGALSAFYRYYAGTRAMWTVAHRDAPEVPALQEPMRAFSSHIDGIAKALFDGFRARRNRTQLRATLSHALGFPTWQSLEALGLDDSRKVALVRRWVEAML